MDQALYDKLFEFDDYDNENVVDSEGNILELAVVPLRDMVIYPHMMSPLFVGRERSLKAIEGALDSGDMMVGLTQKDPEIVDPKPDQRRRQYAIPRASGRSACRGTK